MNLCFQTPEKCHEKAAEQEIDSCSEEQREECLVGPGPDDIRCLCQIHDRDISRHSSHLDSGNKLTAVSGQEMDQGLGQDHLQEGLHFSEAERHRRPGLPLRHCFDSAAENLRAVG